MVINMTQAQIQPKIINHGEVFYKKVGRKIPVIIRIWPHPTMGPEWYKSPFLKETKDNIKTIKEITDYLVKKILKGPYYCQEYETVCNILFSGCLTNHGIVIDVLNLNT